jgi:hypothetical protein
MVDHVMVHCSPKTLEAPDRPGVGAFTPRESDTNGLSCDWLERLDQPSVPHACLHLGQLLNAAGILTVRKSHRFAGLNVGGCISRILDTQKMALSIECDGETRESHSLVRELNSKLEPHLVTAIASELVECVVFCHPAME